MQPLFIILLAAGTAYAVSLLQTAKAAKSLRYGLSRIQLYQFASGGALTFRVWITFTNLTNAALTVQQIYLDAYLTFSGMRHRMATLNTGSITIPANATVERSFDIRVPWANLGVATIAILTGFLNGGRANWPTEATVEGQIKAKGISIPVNETVPFSFGGDTAQPQAQIDTFTQQANQAVANLGPATA